VATGAVVVLGLVACGGATKVPLIDGGVDSGVRVPDGSVGVDPQLVDFGQVVVQTSIAKQITLTNTSDLQLTITPSTLTGSQFFTVSQTTPFTLNANSYTAILATYAPMTPSGGAKDQATFSIGLSTGALVLITLQGEAVQSALQITPNPMDFNFVQPGQQRTMALQIQNVGNVDVNISSIAVTDPGAGQVFALAAGAPMTATVQAGKSIAVNVTFSPTAAQEYVGALEIASNDHLPQQLMTLKGYGGGAAITCTPSALDFSIAPAGYLTTLPVICTNTGSDVLVAGSPDPNAELRIPQFVFSGADAGVFSAAIDSSSPQGPLRANQSVLIDVSYMPTMTETDSATLTVVSNVTTPPAPPVLSLTGQAIQEQKCYYRLTPTSLDWGQVSPLVNVYSPYRQAFTITNLGPNECLVNAVNILPGSDPAFSTTQIVSQRLSPPGDGGQFPTQLEVPVSLLPQLPGNYSGIAGFAISDPDRANVQVPLSGTAGNSCFSVKPGQLDFGVLGPVSGGYCSASRSFTASNGCATSVTLTGVVVTLASDAFSVDAGISLLTLAAYQSASVAVTFTPTSPGSYYGTAQVQTDLQSTPFDLFMGGTLAPGSTWTDSFRGNGPVADILWVMDTADSDEREQVATYASDFINSLEANGVDFQMGVTSTDVCTAGTAEDGRLVPCSGCHLAGNAAPQIVTQYDPNAGSDLAYLMGLGGANDDDCGTGDDEQFFEATYEALVSGIGASVNNALGFIRPSAFLAVIAVNSDDSDDQSAHTPQWYADEFHTIKGTTHPGLFSWWYIDPSQYGAPGGSQPFNRLPARISSMLDLAGGGPLDTTVPQWYQALFDQWSTTNNQYPLTGTPAPSSIDVYLDGPPPDQVPDGGTAGSQIFQTNPDGSWNWRYDSATNVLQANPASLNLLPTDTLYVEYTLICP
jgi:hypothetical protein